MNSKFKKISAVVLSCSVVICSISATVLAVAENGMAKFENSTETVKSLTDTAGEKAIVKDETVYVLASADGSVEKIIVSDWIKNSLGSKTVTDKSDLENIENVKGDESYTINTDNMKVWDADGNDIYYQGNISKELPVNLTVTYKLDGKTVSSKEIAGKSGKVTVRFDYQNNQYETVEIDGKTEKIYVPFAMLTGLILDNNTFSNVEVSNGKLINDGDRTFVAGLAFPSLQENLNISKSEFEIPDYIEITADAENFELGNTVTVATNEIFNKIDTENLGSLDSLTAASGELSTSINALIDGSSTLYGGLCTLLNKSQELISGINRLSDGAAQLKAGAYQLDCGADELLNGTEELANGIAQLTENNATLNNGSKQVFETLLSSADTALSNAGLTVPTLTIENYSKTLTSVINSLNAESIRKTATATAQKNVTDAVNSQKSVIMSAVTESVHSNVLTQVLSVYGVTKEQYDSGIMVNEINAAVETQMQSEGIKNTINTETENQIAALIEQNMNSEAVQSQINTAVTNAAAAVESIKTLKAQLDSYNEFYSGLQAYTNGVSSAKAGAEKLNGGTAELKDGTAELYDGATELYDGILTLKDGTPSLIDGITELKDGSQKLSDGLKEFNEKGIQKIIDALNGDAKGLITRIKATVDVSKNYKSFSGISDVADGQVKFIYRTDSVTNTK